jgi:hypothetical protein
MTILYHLIEVAMTAVLVYAIKACGEVDVHIHSLSTFALDGGQWWALHPGRFTPQRESTHGIHWEGPRADENTLHKKKKSCPYYGLKNFSTVKHTALAVPTMLSWLHRTEIANLHACQSEYTFFVNFKSPPPFIFSIYKLI